MVEIEGRAAKDLVHRPCWGEFRRHFTGDFECRSRWRASDSYWETGLEGSRARCNLGLRYKRCRFPPMHYLTKFQVWILLLEKTGGLLRDICWRKISLLEMKLLMTWQGQVGWNHCSGTNVMKLGISGL